MNTIKYQDLPEERKEQERQKYREHGLDYDWWEGVYNDAKETAEEFGLCIEDINFSGFWSQGDGVCYKGGISFEPCDESELPEEVRGVYQTLHEVDSLMKIINREHYLYAQITTSGTYCHKHSMRFDFYNEGGLSNESSAVVKAREKDICEALRDYARWIYRTLEKEYEYLTSDECIDEQLHDEEYENEQENNG